MKLNKIHKKIIQIIFESKVNNDNCLVVDLLILLRKHIKKDNSLEYYIGQLLVWKYLVLNGRYIELVDDKYKIVCKINLKNKFRCGAIG